MVIVGDDYGAHIITNEFPNVNFIMQTIIYEENMPK